MVTQWAIVLFTHVESISASGALIKIINQRLHLQCAYGRSIIRDIQTQAWTQERKKLFNSQDVRYVTFFVRNVYCTVLFPGGHYLNTVTEIKVM